MPLYHNTTLIPETDDGNSHVKYNSVDQNKITHNDSITVWERQTSPGPSGPFYIVSNNLPSFDITWDLSDSVNVGKNEIIWEVWKEAEIAPLRNIEDQEMSLIAVSDLINHRGNKRVIIELLNFYTDHDTEATISISGAPETYNLPSGSYNYGPFTFNLDDPQHQIAFRITFKARSWAYNTPAFVSFKTIKVE